jgi:hypothetical protein
MTASVLPELWRALRTRPARPPIAWRSIRVITALTVASGALMWAGVTLVGVGEVRLGWWCLWRLLRWSGDHGRNSHHPR